jgi:pimeloyl-ACP methyl ester carboxylesterase
MRGIAIPERAVKAWKKLLAIAGTGLLLLGASFIRRAALPSANILIAAGECHTPATVLDPPAGVAAVGSAILLHGLGANRRTMTYLGTDFAGHGFRTYLLDLPGHGDNTDAFTFAKAQECADRTVGSLIRDGKIDPGKTILLGHSMGGAIAVRMADLQPLAATIALAPAPMATPRRMPSNLLIFSGQYDLGILKRQAQTLAAAAGGERVAPQDFAEQRASALEVLPHSTHTGPLIDRSVAHRSEQWAMQALFPGVDAKTIALNLDLATYDTFKRGRLRLPGAVLGLLGLALLFPACATLSGLAAGLAAGPRLMETSATGPSQTLAIVEQAVCALVSVLILTVVVPLRFVRLYDGDYLASLLLLSGSFLLALNWKYARANKLSGQAWRLIVASAAGIAVILSLGAWINWQLSDLWMNQTRWLRFAELLPVAWIFSFAEEVILGPVGTGRYRARRFAVFLAMRLELWLACVLGYYLLGSGQALIGVIGPGLASFSIVQRLATDALRLRLGLGSATAAAAFSAILAAWLIAAVFPLR